MRLRFERYIYWILQEIVNGCEATNLFWEPSGDAYVTVHAHLNQRYGDRNWYVESKISENEAEWLADELDLDLIVKR